MPKSLKITKFLLTSLGSVASSLSFPWRLKQERSKMAFFRCWLSAYSSFTSCIRSPTYRRGPGTGLRTTADSASRSHAPTPRPCHQAAAGAYAEQAARTGPFALDAAVLNPRGPASRQRDPERAACRAVTVRTEHGGGHHTLQHLAMAVLSQHHLLCAGDPLKAKATETLLDSINC